MADIDYRQLTEQTGFEKFVHHKNVSKGWKRFLIIPVGTSILLNVKTLTNGTSGNLLIVSVDTLDEVTLTKLSGNGTNSPGVRVTTDDGLPNNSVGLEIFLGTTKDLSLEFTSLGIDGTSFDNCVDSKEDTVIVSTLDLSYVGLSSSKNILVGNNTVYHKDNLPPIATKSESLAGNANNKFLTPYSMSEIIKSLQLSIEKSVEGIVAIHEPSRLNLHSLNLIHVTGSMELPPGQVGAWLRFAIHPTISASSVLFQSSDNEKVIVRTVPYDSFSVDPKDTGVEFRAYVNEQGKWEVLL